jgi:raffinose/stachyose/melibiose transport system substrate-binding protein
MPDVTPWFIFGKEAWHLGHLIEFIPHGYLKQTLGTLECRQAMLDNDSAKLNFGAADGAMAVFAQNLLDLQANGLINEDVLTATSDNCVEAFVTGKAAMFSNGMWALSSLLEANPDMADKIGFAPYPSYMPDSEPVVLCAEDSGYSISATSENVDAAKAFLNYLFSADNQKKYSEALGSPSAFTDVDADWAPAAFAAEVNNVLNTAVNIGYTNEKPAGFSGDDAGRLVQDLLAGTYDAQGFAKAYEKAWNEGFEASAE